MKRIYILIILFILSPNFILAQLIGSPIAVVKLTESQAIYKKDLDSKIKFYEQNTGKTLGKKEKLELLNSQISVILVKQAAKSEGIQALSKEVEIEIEKQKSRLPQTQNLTMSQYKALIEEQGIKYSEYIEQIKDGIILQKYIKKHAKDTSATTKPPTENEIQNFYDSQTELFLTPKMARIEQIFRETKGKSPAEISNIKKDFDGFYSKIKSGGKKAFDKIVVSLVSNSDYKVGDSGFFNLSKSEERDYYLEALGSDFVDVVSKAKENSFTNVIKSNVGFHIVYVSNIEKPRLLGIDDTFVGQNLTVREKIKEYLAMQKQEIAKQEAVKEMIDSLKKKASIDIKEEML